MSARSGGEDGVVDGLAGGSQGKKIFGAEVRNNGHQGIILRKQLLQTAWAFVRRRLRRPSAFLVSRRAGQLERPLPLHHVGLVPVPGFGKWLRSCVRNAPRERRARTRQDGSPGAEHNSGNLAGELEMARRRVWGWAWWRELGAGQGRLRKRAWTNHDISTLAAHAVKHPRELCFFYVMSSARERFGCGEKEARQGGVIQLDMAARTPKPAGSNKDGATYVMYAQLSEFMRSGRTGKKRSLRPGARIPSCSRCRRWKIFG